MISQNTLATQAEVGYPEFPLTSDSLDRAETYLESGLVSEAAEIYEEMIARGEDSPRVQMGLAQCAYRRRLLHEALGHLHAVLQSAPHYPNVHNDLGVVLFELGLCEEAQLAFQEALAQDPADPQPLRNLMDAAIAADDWNACIECCENILARDPDDAEVQQVLEAERLRAAERAEAVKLEEPERSSRSAATPTNTAASAEATAAASPRSAAAPAEATAAVSPRSTAAPAVPDAARAWLDEPTPAVQAAPTRGPIEGVTVVSRTPEIDERGYRIRVVATGETPPFSQVTVEGNLKAGSTRGFHKHPRREWIFIGRGAAKIVLIDDRPESAHQMQTVIAGERNPTRIEIPPGVLHGWLALADETELIVASSEPGDDRIEDNRHGALLSRAD